MISWHRFYDPTTGRYITADPIGLDGGMNLYAFVGGNPIARLDPLGLADYLVYWDYYSVTYGAEAGVSIATVSGTVVSSDKKKCGPCAGNYEAIDFKGTFYGVAVGALPGGYNFNNVAKFSDNHPDGGDVNRIKGKSSLISGTVSLGNGKSYGSYSFGELNSSISDDKYSGTEGLDAGLDYMPFGDIELIGSVYCVSSPYFGAGGSINRNF